MNDFSRQFLYAPRASNRSSSSSNNALAWTSTIAPTQFSHSYYTQLQMCSSKRVQEEEKANKNSKKQHSFRRHQELHSFTNTIKYASVCNLNFMLFACFFFLYLFHLHSFCCFSSLRLVAGCYSIRSSRIAIFLCTYIYLRMYVCYYASVCTPHGVSLWVWAFVWCAKLSHFALRMYRRKSK